MLTRAEFDEFLKNLGHDISGEEGIATVQRTWGVPETGVIDGPTMTAVSKLPRCGFTDRQNMSGQLDRWGLPVVTYYIEQYPVGLGLTKEQVDEIVRLSCKGWSDICGLDFARANSASSANIVMGTGRGRIAGFDGPSGILAYCEIPQGPNYRGRIGLKWDLDEAWTISRTVNGILLLNTTAHELGHGIGHYHNNEPNQLLNPIYNPQIATPQSYDIQEAVSRYGKRVLVAPPVTPPTVPGSPTAVTIRATKHLMSDGTVWYADSFRKINNAQFEGVQF